MCYLLINKRYLRRERICIVKLIVKSYLQFTNPGYKGFSINTKIKEIASLSICEHRLFYEI